MRKALAIMKESVRKPLEDPKPSMSGLIGGEAKQITGYRESGTNVCGTFMNKLIAYSMAVLEVNASMGVIVAAPTAGSSPAPSRSAAADCSPRGNAASPETWTRCRARRPPGGSSSARPQTRSLGVMTVQNTHRSAPSRSPPLSRPPSPPRTDARSGRRRSPWGRRSSPSGTPR